MCGSTFGQTEGVDPKTGDICRLNREGVGRVLSAREDKNVYAPGVTVTPNGVQVGGASAGGSGSTVSKSGAGKVGVGAAVLGMGAGMVL